MLEGAGSLADCGGGADSNGDTGEERLDKMYKISGRLNKLLVFYKSLHGVYISYE